MIKLLINLFFIAALLTISGCSGCRSASITKVCGVPDSAIVNDSIVGFPPEGETKVPARSILITLNKPYKEIYESIECLIKKIGPRYEKENVHLISFYTLFPETLFNVELDKESDLLQVFVMTRSTNDEFEATFQVLFPLSGIIENIGKEVPTNLVLQLGADYGTIHEAMVYTYLEYLKSGNWNAPIPQQD